MTKHFLSILFTVFSLSSFALDYGLDRLNEPAIAAKIHGKTLAVLTHAASRSKTGEHLIDILFKNYDLQKIFAPEHGLRTLADDWVGDGTDEATGLPVISLYKRGTRAPNAADLQGIDAVVIDLQDVGVRYYTYFSTIAEVMKVCAASNVEVILLDRPNLLGGMVVEGKVLEASLAGSFTAYHTVPTRHGMTLGELAQMVNVEKSLNVKLTVIPASGWKRESLLTNTERPWIAPSPALIDLEQVGLYAIWGTLEDFNISVGRGTTNELAFKILGAPWITPAESVKLAVDLNKLGFKGASFAPFNWLVTRAVHAGKKAYGVKLTWTGEEIRTDEFTYKVASHLVNQFKNRINSSAMSPQGYGSTSMVNAIRGGTSWETFRKVIDPELEAFKLRRLPYLLYSRP